MKFSRLITATASAALLVAAGLLGPAAASAETTELGQQGRIDDGNVVQGWTISDLKPSSDVVTYPIQGALWEATATSEAIQGTVVPIISNFNARTATGEDYRVLFQIASIEGVKPGALTQGQQTKGKVYFDVIGAAPDSVVYNNGSQDLITWVQLAPKPAAASTGGPAESLPAPATTPTPAATPTAVATPVPAAPPTAEPIPGRQGTPLPADAPNQAPVVEGTPHGPAVSTPPTGSQGTPLPPEQTSTPAVEGTPHGPQTP